MGWPSRAGPADSAAALLICCCAGGFVLPLFWTSSTRAQAQHSIKVQAEIRMQSLESLSRCPRNGPPNSVAQSLLRRNSSHYWCPPPSWWPRRAPPSRCAAQQRKHRVGRSVARATGDRVPAQPQPGRQTHRSHTPWRDLKDLPREQPLRDRIPPPAVSMLLPRIAD